MASADRSRAVVTILCGTPRYEVTETDPPARTPASASWRTAPETESVDPWLFIGDRRRPGILADIEADLERAPELIAEEGVKIGEIAPQPAMA